MNRGLVHSWFRTLLIQSSWNYQRMIGVGIAYASEPILRKLPGGREGDEYREAMGRATQQFNSHPYFAGAAVGALAKTEHEQLRPEQISRFRTALSGPLGSVGDRLIWAGSLPVASAIGLTLAVVVSPVVGVIALLGIHNLVNFGLRIWALKVGWEGGVNVSGRLGVPPLVMGLKIAAPATALAVGFMLPVVTSWLVADFEPNGITGAGLVAGAGLLLARWIWPTLGGIRYGLIVVVIAALAGWI